MAGGTAVAKLLIDVAFNGQEAGAQADGLASKFSSMAKTIIASALGIGGALGAAGILKSAISASSDLEQAMGGVDAVFKESAGAIHEWASDTSDSFRLPQAEAEQFATVVGAQLKNAGFAMRDLAPETEKLITLGGDLASTFGGPTSDAVTALGAALRGETDPIERYGVTMNQAAVEAKALAIAQETGADAADKATIMQARLALIYEQTADAQGQAARESQTFAAAQEKLGGAFNTLLTTLGGPILQAAADFLSFLADVLKLIQPVIAAIGALLGWFAQLPGPIQAAGLALAGLAVFMGPALLTVFKAFVLLIPGLISGMGGMSAASSRLGVALSALSARFTSVGTAARGFGLAAIGLAGGWALAIAAAVGIATIALMSWVDANRRAEEAMQETAAATDSFLEILKQANEIGGEASGRALRLKSWEMMSEKFKETGKSVSEVAANIGVDMQDMITGLASNGREGQQVIDAFNAKIADLTRQQQLARAESGRFSESGIGMNDADLQKQIDDVIKQRDAYINLTPSIEAARAKFDEYNKVVGETPEDDKTKSVEELEGALKAAQAAAKAAFETGFGNSILAEFADRANAAARAASIFNAMTDDAAGRNRDYQQTTLAMTAGLEDVAGAFKSAAEAGQLNKDALVNWDIGALADAGDKSRALTSSLLDLSAQYGKFVTQAFESGKATSSAADAQGRYNDGLMAAHVAADQARADFMEMAQAAGLTSDEAAALADQLGIVDAAHIDDKKFDIIAKDQEAMMTMKLWETVKLDPVTKQFYAEVPAAQVLADQMNAEINKTNPNPIPVKPEVGAPGLTSNTPAAQAAAGQNPGMTPVSITPQVQQPTGAVGGVVGELFEDGESKGEFTVSTTLLPPVTPGGPIGKAVTGGGTVITEAISVPVRLSTADGRESLSDQSFGKIFDTSKIGTVRIQPTVEPAVGATNTPAGQATTTTGAVEGGKVNVGINVDQSGLAAIQGAIADMQGKTVSLTVTADTTQAWNAISLITSAAAALPATVIVTGDNTQAIASIRNVTTGHYDTTVFVKGDNNDAIRSIRNVTTGHYETVIYALGDNNGAISAIRNVTTGYYSATIYIGADASGFYAVWNSLPSSKTITVTVNQVQGSVVAPPAPGGRSAEGFVAPAAFGAPTVTATPMRGSRTASGSTVTNITIQAGVGDPDAIARAVKRVLVGRDRRSGGVVVGGVRRAI